MVDGARSMSTTATGSAGAAVPETGSARPVTALSACGVRGSGRRRWVRTSLGMRGPSSTKPVTAAAATSTLARARLRKFSSGSGSTPSNSRTNSGLVHRTRRSMSRNAASSWSLSTAHLLNVPYHDAVSAFVAPAA